MKKRWWGLLGLLVIAGLVLKTFVDTGELKQLTPHFEGSCRAVQGMPGAEDLTFHPTLDFAYVSSDDRWATMRGKPVPGGIYRYTPGQPEPAQLLTGSFKQPFHPHGISLFVDSAGKQTLFVINHPEPGEGQVERFTVGSDGLLIHEQTLRDPALRSPNDLVAVDDRRFYASNDHHFAPGVLRTIEEYGQLPIGSVVYFDGKAFREVITGTNMANGINRSTDGKTVYLAESIGQSLSVYSRDPSSGALTLRQEVPLGTGLDNIELTREGDLLIGAHPKLLTFVKHAKDLSGKTPAPSQVLHVQAHDGSYQVRELYLGEGKQLSAVAVAAQQGKHLLLGPVFDPQLLDCLLP